jgi:hypothetical protein
VAISQPTAPSASPRVLCYGRNLHKGRAKAPLGNAIVNLRKFKLGNLPDGWEVYYRP